MCWLVVSSARATSSISIQFKCAWNHTYILTFRAKNTCPKRHKAALKTLFYISQDIGNAMCTSACTLKTNTFLIILWTMKNPTLYFVSVKVLFCRRKRDLSTMHQYIQPWMQLFTWAMNSFVLGAKTFVKYLKNIADGLEKGAWHKRALSARLLLQWVIARYPPPLLQIQQTQPLSQPHQPQRRRVSGMMFSSVWDTMCLR